MKYKDFSDEFLVAAYKESRHKPGETLRSGDIIDQYPLVFEPGWVVQLVRDLGTRGYLTSKGVDADDRGQPVRLTGRGLRVAEDLIEKGVGIFRLDLGEGVGFPPAEEIPARRDSAPEATPIRPVILPVRRAATAPPRSEAPDWGKHGVLAAWIGVLVAIIGILVTIWLAYA